MVKNHCLAKSISDSEALASLRASAAWVRFREWLEYFGVVYGVPVIAVNPSYTSQDCSNCGFTVVKTLSTRTHKCPHCDFVADRDENAALNILKSALKEWANTVGRTEFKVSGEIPLCFDVEGRGLNPNFFGQHAQMKAIKTRLEDAHGQCHF